MALRPGLLLGRYECLMPIARGGMASVWAGRLRGARGFERLVAIKTILPSLAEDPSFVQMFLEEGRIAARIQHPNVVPVLDLGEQDDLLYLVLDWVEGEPLSMLLREALSRRLPIPEGIAGRIVVDVCAGLHAVHEQRDDEGRLLGLVHRDISPQNVLIASDGQVRLVDFGVAKATLRSISETAPGVLKGKAGYVAPEQALGRPVDRRADLFAVGILLFQMVTGRHPFRGENEVATLANLLSRGVPAPGAVAGRPPSALDVVILRALSRPPEERFPDAIEMARAVEVALRGELASPAQVATFLGAVVGERIAARRHALRKAIFDADRGVTGEVPELSTPSQQLAVTGESAPWGLDPASLPAVPAPPSAEVSAPAVEAPPSGASTPRRRAPGWALGGGALLVASAFALLLRARSAPEEPRILARALPETPRALPSTPPEPAPPPPEELPTSVRPVPSASPPPPRRVFRGTWTPPRRLTPAGPRPGLVLPSRIPGR
jgi:serine/threonine protein kinase